MAESEGPNWPPAVVFVAIMGFMAMVSAAGSWSNAEQAKSTAALVAAHASVVQASCTGDLTEPNRAKLCADAMAMLKRVK